MDDDVVVTGSWEGCTSPPAHAGPGRFGFRAAISALLLAPVVVMFSGAAHNGGLCRGAGTARRCPSDESIYTVMTVCLGALAAVLVFGIVVLVGDLVRPRTEPTHEVPVTPGGNALTNKKALVSVVLALLAAASWAGSVPDADVEMYVFVSIPATLYAMVFALRAMGELRDAHGRDQGRGAAIFGLSVALLVATASVLTLVV